VNTDIRLQVSFFMHHKTLKLESILGEAGPLRLIQLWTWVAMNKPDGNLKGMGLDEVELAAGWRGDSGQFIDTLIKCKFVDGTSGSYKIHDWEYHNPYAASSGERIKRAVKANATRAANDLGLEGDEREKFIAKRVAKRTAKRSAKSTPPSPSPSPSPSPPPLGSPAAKPPGKAKGNSEPMGNPVKIWIDLMKELRDDIYKPNGPAVGNIRNAFKHLKGDGAEFEKRARNYLGSEFVKMPTPAKFYNSIENYKAGGDDKFFDEDKDF